MGVAGSHAGPDRTESFEPDHCFVENEAKSTSSKTVFTCDGSCGIDNCREQRVIPEDW